MQKCKYKKPKKNKQTETILKLESYELIALYC